MKTCVLIILLFFVKPVEGSSTNLSLKEAINKINANVVFMRHAIAPGYGDPYNFDIKNCSKQRNLDLVGKKQALLIGKYFKKKQIRFDEIFSSEWCRCIDTIKHMDIGKWITFAGLNSYFQGYASKQKVIAKLHKKLRTLKSDNLVLMVTHQIVIADLTNIYVPSGGIVLYNTFSKKSKSINLNFIKVISSK